jgi:hypothetical protein
MEIEIFTLCDYAQDINGKLIVVGTFDLINANSFPSVHPSCAIAGRFRFSDKELGQHSLRIKLIDEKGKDLITPVEGNIQVNKPLAGHYATMNFVLNLSQLKFETQGRYSFELYIDGEWKSGLPLVLNKT